MVFGPPEAWPPGTDILAVDLDLRERSHDEAYAATSAAARQLSANRRLFVKIDSTLRGPIAGLVSGALDGSGRQIAMIAPSFPEQGRGRISTDALKALAIESENHSEWLLVGSAGLARHLAARSPFIETPLVPGGQPVLVVAGSPAPATQEQLRHLESVEQVVVLRSLPTLERDEGQAAAELAQHVAEWATSNGRPRAVVLTGGATARAVCRRLGATGFQVRGELAPGIPLSILEGGIWDDVTVVTKAGGFGTADILLDVARALGVSSI